MNHLNTANYTMPCPEKQGITSNELMQIKGILEKMPTEDLIFWSQFLNLKPERRERIYKLVEAQL